MPIAQEKNVKRETLNLRVKPELRTMIDRAAGIVGKNRTDFVLDAARRAAQDTLLDQSELKFSSVAYATFLARLDAKPQPNDRLKKSLGTAAFWE